jgi:hypothetical protein
MHQEGSLIFIPERGKLEAMELLDRQGLRKGLQSYNIILQQGLTKGSLTLKSNVCMEYQNTHSIHFSLIYKPFPFLLLSVVTQDPEIFIALHSNMGGYNLVIIPQYDIKSTGLGFGLIESLKKNLFRYAGIAGVLKQ